MAHNLDPDAFAAIDAVNTFMRHGRPEQADLGGYEYLTETRERAAYALAYLGGCTWRLALDLAERRGVPLAAVLADYFGGSGADATG